MREMIPEANRRIGAVASHDISVPIAKVPAFIDRAGMALARIAPFRVNCFGHLGDGNLHYNVVLPRDLPEEDWVREGERITRTVYDLVDELGGSFSAEHGVGQAKKAWLATYRAGAELDLMKTLKKTLDPANILNPGKLF